MYSAEADDTFILRHSNGKKNHSPVFFLTTAYQGHFIVMVGKKHLNGAEMSSMTQQMLKILTYCTRTKN